VNVRDVRAYEGSGYSLFTTLIDVKNVEKRNSDIPALVGHFKSSDGLMFPAQISEVNKKISPLGVATLLVSANIPGNVDMSNIQLVLGEGVKDGKLAVGKGSDAYVNAVAFNLPAEAAKPQSDFVNMTLFPYTVSLSNISARLATTESFLFKFNYELSKNTFVDVSGGDHKLLIEFEDKNGGIAFSKEFTLSDSTEEHKTDSTVLQVGSHSKDYEIADRNILLKLQTLQTYKVKIYDLYNGHKKLLAEQEKSWL
jgi:hypothetical protein